MSGDVSQVTAISASLRLTVRPSTHVPVVVTERGDAPAGWDLALSTETSASLAEGLWQLDARLEIGETIVFTDPIGIVVVSPASGT